MNPTETSTFRAVPKPHEGDCVMIANEERTESKKKEAQTHFPMRRYFPPRTEGMVVSGLDWRAAVSGKEAATQENRNRGAMCWQGGR